MQWFGNKLKSLGRTFLDARWTICPCSGIDKIPAFLSLFSANKLNIAVVTDFAHGSKQRVRELKESKLLQNGHVLSLDTYANQAEADIEDVIGREMYIDLVSETYGLKGKKALPAKKPSAAPIRAVKEVEEFFKTLPSEILAFDHYSPSEHLTKSGLEVNLPGLEGALDRFEKLFLDLNKMLPG